MERVTNVNYKFAILFSKFKKYSDCLFKRFRRPLNKLEKTTSTKKTLKSKNIKELKHNLKYK